jgi:hypothetical protein
MTRRSTLSLSTFSTSAESSRAAARRPLAPTVLGAVNPRLNTTLHAQLIRDRQVRPSTFESAMAALEAARKRRGG